MLHPLLRALLITSWLAGACVLSGCSAEKGLLIFEIKRDEDVPELDWIEITANERKERFRGSLERKPGLSLREGSYEIQVDGILGEDVVASAPPLDQIQVVSDNTRVVSVRLRLRSQIEEDPGAGDAGMDAAARAQDGGQELDAESGHRDDSAIRPTAMDSSSLDAEHETGASDSSHQDSAIDPPALIDAPRNPSCHADGGELNELSFKDDFDTRPLGPIADDASSPWIEAERGRGEQVTTTWARAGQALMLYSFTSSSEWLYARLEAPLQPARIVLELWYTPDGYYDFYDQLMMGFHKDFAEIGLAHAGATKFDVKPLFALRAQDHALIFNAHPGKPKAGVAEPGVSVFEEIEYARQTFGEAPLHNYLRVEIDLCTDEARFFAGPDESAPLRKTVAFDPLERVNAYYLAGGLNPTYIDAISVLMFY